MLFRTTIVVAIVSVSAGAGIAASRVLDIELSPRAATATPEIHPATGHAATTPAAPASPQNATATHAAPTDVRLPMRLVDAGGVGIVPDSVAWAAASYSHGTGAFHALIRPGTTELDAAALERIERDWRTYVDRMTRFGANGVIVGAFLELIDFDRLAGGDVVYPAGGEFRRRHAALRDAFGGLFAYARRAGMGVYLKTDMLALTEPLERVLSARAGGLDGLDTDDPRLWRVYATGLDELFDRMPDVRGVVVRVGEAGALYNVEGWPYWSEMAVREPEELRLMLETLLPVFERHGRDLVLRSWSVGVGALGGLHTDPVVYDEVLGDIDSPSLVVSTKFTQGDYFGFLPLNPTLAQGGHRRLIEFQARREFEGFGALPNFLAAEHARAIRTLARANPNIAGISLWTQEGGPLHAGPMSIYPLHGYWRWIDANVYATLRLAADPATRPAALAAEWVRANVSSDPVVVETLADVLLRSRAPVEKALYVRPFAEQRARIGGIESTPMMWIMEWDVVGDWSAVSSTIYRASRGRLEEAIADGFDAAGEAREMRRAVEALAPRLGDDPDFKATLRSLTYQESLFQALAWYRKALLTYYAQLDTGEPGVLRDWHASADRFRDAAHAHADEFAGDLDFPAYDFEPALDGLDRAERNALARGGARATLALIALVLVAGAPILRRAATDSRGAWMLGVLALVACGMAATFLFAFEARAVGRGLVMLLATFIVALKGGWSGPTLSRRDVHAAAVLGPLFAGALATLVMLAARGPDHFWFLFWSDGRFRATAIGLAVAVTLWMLASAHTAGRRAAGLAAPGALGSTMLATGMTLVALSLLLPDLPSLLASLDAPLSMLPIRFALVVAATTYAGVPAIAPWYPAIAGVMLAAAGGGLRQLERSRFRRAPEQAEEALAQNVERLTADA